MSFIDPADYDREEAAAMRSVPNRVMEAYRPEAFAKKGYPTHIKEAKELYRYVDAMYETPNHIEYVMEKWLGGLTKEEFSLLKNVFQAASDMAVEVSGRSAIPARSVLPR